MWLCFAMRGYAQCFRMLIYERGDTHKLYFDSARTWDTWYLYAGRYAQQLQVLRQLRGGAQKDCIGIYTQCFRCLIVNL